ncbi:hypothetical protein TNCV_924491 [Trichonephila clavipes]|nr:hypothetical protein TNCV_924491 [Trichonephila clavipes]
MNFVGPDLAFDDQVALVTTTTSMSYPGFEPSPYGNAVSVTSHCTRWAAISNISKTIKNLKKLIACDVSILLSYLKYSRPLSNEVAKSRKKKFVIRKIRYTKVHL